MTSPHPIAVDAAARRGVGADAVMSRSQTSPVVAARQDAAYRLWTETDLSTREVARRIGRRDHGAAIHAILAGARRAGRDVATVSELRGAVRDLDWTKLAYATAGWRSAHDLPIDRAAAATGIGRAEWRKAELGRSLSAATLLSLCRTTGFDPMALLPVSRETPVKHDAGRRAA